MPDPDSKYAVSNRPVNSRTSAVPTRKVNPVIHERLEAVRARSQLGPSLTGRLRQSGNRGELDPLTVVGGIAATLSVVAFFLSWLQSSVLLPIAAAAGLGAASMLIVWRRRLARNTAAQTQLSGATVLDEESLARLDDALNRLLAEVTDDLAARVMLLKDMLVRIGRQMGTTADEHFTLEDRFYVRESVRRYLPDSVEAYLGVPRTQRTQSLGNDEQTAETLLRSQIALIELELQTKEAKLGRSAAEQLLRQQRFLESKATRG